MKSVTIYSRGSCDTTTRKGFSEVILEYGKTCKYLYLEYEDTTTNRCILSGFIHAASLLKQPCNITFVSSCALGTQKAHRGVGRNADLHKELMQIITLKECDVSFDVWVGRGDKLNEFIEHHKKLSLELIDI